MVCSTGILFFFDTEATEDTESTEGGLTFQLNS